MSVRKLDAGQSAPLDQGRVEAELVVLVGGPLRLEARHPDSGDPVEAWRLGDTLLDLTDAGAPVQLVAEPCDATIPDDTRAQVVVTVSIHGQESRVLGPVTDLGALNRAALAEVRLTTDGRVLSALRVDGVGSGEDLPPLARAVQFAARRLVQAGQVSAASAGVAVCLDVSASMFVQVDDGLAQLMCEVALGLDRGLGDGGDVPVVAVGQSVARLAPITSASASDYVDATVAGLVPATGCRLELMREHVGDLLHDERAVVVVTDHVPADPEDLARTWKADGGAATVHVAVLGQPPSLAPLAPPVPITYVDTSVTRESLLEAPGHAERLDAMVRSLMGPRPSSVEEGRPR